MMASYIILYILCVVLCAVHPVHSRITGSVQHDNGSLYGVEILDYISGENWTKIRHLTLDRLEDAATLPSLTIANFQSLNSVDLMNLALEQVPVFVNTSISNLIIRGNNIQSVPANAFSGPRPSELYLFNNKIHSMADNSVNVNARFVNLQCNELGHFSQAWFENPKSVDSLDLSGNQIEQLEERAFSQMTKLDVLRVQSNRITSIGTEALPARLTYLYLQFNGVAQITLDMFAKRDKRMYGLHLHHNQLSYLPESLLRKLKPIHVSLTGNPWQCQCLQDIERWLRELNSTRWDIPSRRGEPACVVPLSFQNVCVPAVDKELQQTYATGLTPLPECLATGCKRCMNIEDQLAKLT